VSDPPAPAGLPDDIFLPRFHALTMLRNARRDITPRKSNRLEFLVEDGGSPQCITGLIFKRLMGWEEGKTVIFNFFRDLVRIHRCRWCVLVMTTTRLRGEPSGELASEAVLMAVAQNALHVLVITQSFAAGSGADISFGRMEEFMVQQDQFKSCVKMFGDLKGENL
jgi:hypothetical protein